MENATGLSFARYEYILLLGLCHAPSLLGEENPFTNLSPEQIAAAMERARQSLQARHLVEVADTGDVAISPPLSALVSVCAFPNYSLIATHTDAQGTRDVRFYHITNQLIVEDAVFEDGSHILTRVPQASLVERVSTQFNLDCQPAAPANQCRLLRTVLEEARSNAASGGIEAAWERLQSAAMDKRTATQLAYALARPVSNSALGVVSYGNELPPPSLGVLEAVNGLWLLRLTADGEHIECIPTDAVALKQLIADSIP
ncbi:MAG: ESX secretion-associated protein EspG [Anaerolineae bacterium]|nr:ESX secretion-associated protein EspG [Anaerolineae bacterium]